MYAHSYGIIPIMLKKGKPCVLVVQHREGHWSFPKGTPEPGEEPLDTARRECMEETGIGKIKIDHHPVFTEQYSFRRLNRTSINDIDKKVTYYLGWVADDLSNNWRARDEGVVAGRWVTFEQAEQLITFAQARTILHQVKTHIDKTQ